MPDAKKGEEPPSGIQVYLRIRPPKGTDHTTYFQRDDIELGRMSVNVPKKNDDTVNNSRNGYSFAFSGILDDKVRQCDVYDDVGAPAVKNALAGFNSTIFAYGQTGSGKTFTITGGPERYDDRGLIPRALAHLFKVTKGEEKRGTSYTCFVSYLEIYNQSGYDLLAEHPGNAALSDVPKVTMLEDEDGNFHFKNLSMHEVSSEAVALDLLFRGETSRAIAATEMNQNSTRSHCIFTLVLEKRRPDSDTIVTSKLNIVDLAGSERVGRTKSAGQTLREAKYINASLFFLEMVIVALHEKETKSKEYVHVPYRNSMMTSVLRDSLGGNCKTLMIATISPEARHTGESISTCRFAQRVALVKNSASVNEAVEPEQVIKRLRAEVRRLRDEVDFLSGKHETAGSDEDSANSDDCGTLPQHQRNEFTEAVRRYVQDPDPSSHMDFCGGITLPKIRALCSMFKDMLREKAIAMRASDDDGNSSNEESHEAGDASVAGNEAQKRGLVSNSRRRAKLHQPHGMHGNPRQHKAESMEKVDTVCGVRICRDKHVLDEPNAAFAWFKERYPGLSAIDKNKTVLKMKYAEAKSAGKRIDEIRSKISHHKDTISEVRKTHAIRMVSGDYGERMREDPTAEEKAHSDAINRAKTTYKETLDNLRGLKGIIESTQKVVERGRRRLQSDFDTWYQHVCYKESQMQGVQRREEGKNAAQPGSTPFRNAENSGSQSTGGPSSSTVGRQTLDGTTCESRQTTSEAPKEAAFKLPPGVQLTGNADADADIVAFYRAKEILLGRK